MSKTKKALATHAVGLLVIAVAALGVISISSAAAPTEGSSVPDSAVPIGTVTTGTSFSSGQEIDVVVPANGVFTSTTQNINILECSAPDGVIPTQPTACDGNTINGNTLDANADGSFDYEIVGAWGEFERPSVRQHSGHRVHPLHRRQPS
jgi:hypothetical protein